MAFAVILTPPPPHICCLLVIRTVAIVSEVEGKYYLPLSMSQSKRTIYIKGDHSCCGRIYFGFYAVYINIQTNNAIVYACERIEH